MSSIALCFISYGPYHLARLDFARARGLAVTGVQLGPVQSEYQWQTSQPGSIVSLSSGRVEDVLPGQWPVLVATALDRLNPAVCAVAGYGHPGMRAILDWCLQRKVPVVLMSDSRYEDEPRHWWKEWTKSLIVRHASAGFVAGTAHARYLESLGLPRDHLFLGYDVVDNLHFTFRSDEARREGDRHRRDYALPDSYFLASARFIPKKNLDRLIEAYARYRRNTEAPFHLVLLGDGPLRDDLVRQIADLNLQAFVHLPGFIQYDQLPVYYGLAEAFILASHRSEQWGLVVNEAMASGLPVLVSDACGCAADLVEDAVNGFVFDPLQVEQIAALFSTVATLSPSERAALGAAARRTIAGWGLDRFTSSLAAAVEKALRTGRPRSRLFERALLRSVLRLG